MEGDSLILKIIRKSNTNAMKGNEIKMGIINRQIPITISNSDCTWNSFEKSITVKGDISGTIPTEELGIKTLILAL